MFSPAPRYVAAVSVLVLSAVSASAQTPALAELAAASGQSFTNYAAPATPAAAPIDVPPGGYDGQNRAWNELVRPLVAYAQQQDALDRAFDNQTRTLLGRTTPGLTMWGKDIADRLSLKGQINNFADTIQTEQRNKTAAYGLAWRLYSLNEITRLDAQGQTLVSNALQRLVALEKDASPAIQKLASLRSGQPGVIAGMMDSSISSGLDAATLGDREVRRYTNGIRTIIAPRPAPAPAPAPSAPLTPVPQWQPVR